jgi:hypothetical protein
MTEVRITVTGDPEEIEVTVVHPLPEQALGRASAFLFFMTRNAMDSVKGQQKEGEA